MDAQEIRAAAADLVLGETCVGCERRGRVLCSHCASGLVTLPFRSRPDPCPPGLQPVWAAAAYDGVVQAALIAHKEHGRLALARPLGEVLAVAAMGLLADTASSPAQPKAQAKAEPIWLVPVPSRRSVVRARGHDPLLRLARAAAAAMRRAGIRCTVARPLRTSRVVADQAGLGAADRSANLAGAFTATLRGRAARHGALVLVDDIITTGATLVEACAALEAAGCPVCGAAVVAATQRRTPGR